jgi:hypothetical protein
MGSVPETPVTAAVHPLGAGSVDEAAGSPQAASRNLRCQ